LAKRHFTDAKIMAHIRAAVEDKPEDIEFKPLLQNVEAY
jgi:hypothetical protein